MPKKPVMSEPQKKLKVEGLKRNEEEEEEKFMKSSRLCSPFNLSTL
jgi:hypothetical protein